MDGSGMLTSFFFGGGYEMQSGGRGLTFCFYIVELRIARL